jgi:hypothetical protein
LLPFCLLDVYKKELADLSGELPSSSLFYLINLDADGRNLDVYKPHRAPRAAVSRNIIFTPLPIEYSHYPESDFTFSSKRAWFAEKVLNNSTSQVYQDLSEAKAFLQCGPQTVKYQPAQPKTNTPEFCTGQPYLSVQISDPFRSLTPI